VEIASGVASTEEEEVRAFVSDQSGNFGSVPVAVGDDFTVIAALTLEAGSYVVSATVALACNQPDRTSVSAMFLLDGIIYAGYVQDAMVGGANCFLVVPLMTGITLDHPATIQVGCRADQAGVASQPTTITALQVESVTRIQNQELT
jgi:hypothetical protein